MHNFSNQFKNEMENDRRNYLVKMDVTTEAGEQFTITNANIWAGTFSLEEATSTSGSFSIGSLIASKLCFSLNNVNDTYSDYNFIDATINLQVGMELSDGTIEMLQYGVFNISESSFTTSAINIVALDNLSKFAHTYDGRVKFPCYAFQVIQSCCYACRVEYDENTIPNILKSYRIQNAPSGDLTYSSLISYLAQIACCYVKADINGKLSFGWYELQAMSKSEDGGTFAYDGLTEEGDPESQLDGGSFDNGSPGYSTGDNYDSGTFRSLNGYHIVNSSIQAEIDTDNVKITGISVTSVPANEDVEADSTFYGREGYVISVAENPLIQEGQSAVVARHIWDSISEMRFRPLSVTILPDPIIEAGDVGQIADKNGNYYPCFFSTVKFVPDGTTTIVCDAVSANRQNAEVKTSAQLAVTQAVKQSRKWYAKAEKAAEDFQTLMANALGFYSSEILDDKGATVKYLHNKPKLESSNIQWKISIDGVAVSLDYGQTWTSGMTKDGNMIANVLSAVGINADWIDAGNITGVSISGGTITGASISGGSVHIGSKFFIKEDGSCTIDELDALNGITVRGTNYGTTRIYGGNMHGVGIDGSEFSLGMGSLVIIGASGRGYVNVTPNNISISGKNVALQEDVDTVSNAVSEMSEKLQKIIGELNSRITELQKEVETLQDKVANHTKRLDNQLARIKALEEKIK